MTIPDATKTRLLYLTCAALVFLFGLSILFFFRDIPFLRGFISDFIVVTFLYFLVKTAIPKISSIKLAAGVFLFACFLELLQYFRLADRLALKGVLRTILGATFDWLDILAYALGLLLTLLIQPLLSRRFSS
ncbi:MAG: DUF2809 domain-containing protein [Spirochaetota bacterium]|nr:DUF2809 domain-containing protein [Spirochaetota bacterium]